jgi:hypothetical protein
LQLIPPSPDPVPGELRGLHRAVRACADAGGEGFGAPHVATEGEHRWERSGCWNGMDGWINRYYEFNWYTLWNGDIILYIYIMDGDLYIYIFIYIYIEFCDYIYILCIVLQHDINIHYISY